MATSKKKRADSSSKKIKAGRTFAVVNQKGGVSKSTTAEAVAAGLILKGYSVLSIDLDQQANFTYTVGADPDGDTAMDILTGEVEARDAIQKTEAGDIIAASKELAGADTVLKGKKREYRLRDALEPLKSDYDFIVIDTPPSLGMITVNALVAANSVIIPLMADIYSLQGVESLGETLKPIRELCNPELKIAGLLLTRYNNRTVLNRDVAETASKLAARLGTKLFKTCIRESVVVREAQISQKTLFKYAPKSAVAKDYLNFIDELLAEGKSHGKKL